MLQPYPGTVEPAGAQVLVSHEEELSVMAEPEITKLAHLKEQTAFLELTLSLLSVCLLPVGQLGQEERPHVL
jgi:hypothetical protein